MARESRLKGTVKGALPNPSRSCYHRSAGAKGANMSHRHLTLLPLLFFYSAMAHAQTVPFEFQTHPHSPVSIVNFIPGTLRAASDRRQFFTVKNDSDKVASAVVFQQTIATGSKTEIVTIELVSIIIRPHEKKRLSVSVRDVWNQLQAAGKETGTTPKPVLSVAVVEFIDGSAWSAPLPLAQALE